MDVEASRSNKTAEVGAMRKMTDSTELESPQVSRAKVRLLRVRIEGKVLPQLRGPRSPPRKA
jgi:hypothetical protein